MVLLSFFYVRQDVITLLVFQFSIGSTNTDGASLSFDPLFNTLWDSARESVPSFHVTPFTRWRASE